MTKLLEGVRILDFTWAWAGPYGTQLLAFMGAEVIKVESRRRLDHTRQRSLMGGVIGGGPDDSPIFNDINLNKLSVTLNLSHPKGVALAKRLVRISDVVTQNMRPGVMEKLGLGYEDLKAIKPDIIMLSSSAVGGSGPERSYTGYAPTFAAMSGLAHISGHADGPPLPLSGSVDNRVATTSAFAVLAALYYRQRTGQGQHIDLSSTEAISALMGDILMDYVMNGRSQERMGNRDPIMAPHNCYPCRDGRWVTIAVGSEEEWQALLRALGQPDWAADQRFADPYARWQNQDALDQLIAQWTSCYTPQEVTETLQRAGVAAMPVLDGPALAQDPHLRQRGFLVEVQHPTLGRKLVVAPPWHFSQTPAQITRPAPLLGQHNDYVLKELLGLSDDEVAALVEEGAVY